MFNPTSYISCRVFPKCPKGRIRHVEWVLPHPSARYVWRDTPQRNRSKSPSLGTADAETGAKFELDG